MTPNERLKMLLPVITAFANDKDIQVQESNGTWTTFKGVPDFWFEKWNWRIKPEPSHRPWKPEEVPVGAFIRPKYITHTDVFMIIGRSCEQIYTSGTYYSNIKTVIAFQKYEHSTDNGKTWHPCGIAIE